MNLYGLGFVVCCLFVSNIRKKEEKKEEEAPPPVEVAEAIDTKNSNKAPDVGGIPEELLNSKKIVYMSQYIPDYRCLTRRRAT